jgi:hypothetical protein
LQLITNPFKIHILYFILLLSSCQSEQVQWIEGLDNHGKGNNNPVIPSALDKQLAYLNKYPKDTLRNFILLRNSITTAIADENEELAYKLIVLSLQKYPDIIFEAEFFNAINNFYTTILKEEETAKWISGIVVERWNKDKKITYFMTKYDFIKEENLKLISYQEGGQLVNMAKIHSLFFPDKEESALFLWRSYEIMRRMGSDKEALSLLDLIIVRHKKWEKLNAVKKERAELIQSKKRSKWNDKVKIPFEINKKDQAPVS